jgi:hypothetical protein
VVAVQLGTLPIDLFDTLGNQSMQSALTIDPELERGRVCALREAATVERLRLWRFDTGQPALAKRAVRFADSIGRFAIPRLQDFFDVDTV